MNRVVSRTVVGILGIGIALAWGCGGDEPKKHLSDGCVQNSDCAASLVCSFGHCHEQCEATKDCPAEARCVKTGEQGNVCQLPAEERCTYNSDCDAPLVCAIDGECHNQCNKARDCVDGQVCASSNVCAETSEVDAENNLLGAGGAAGGAGLEDAGGSAGSVEEGRSASIAAGSAGRAPGGAGSAGAANDTGLAGAAGSESFSGQGGVAASGGTDLPMGGSGVARTAGEGGINGPTGDAGSARVAAGAGVGGSGGTTAGGSGGAAGSSSTTSLGGSSSTGGTAGGEGGVAGGGSEVLTGCGATPLSTRYFCDDFESGLSKWELSGQDWDTIASTSRSPTHCVTDSPDGDYPHLADYSLTMAASVDLTSATAPVLVFWQKRVLSSDGGTASYSATDAATVEASADGGLTWETLVSYRYETNTSTWTAGQFSLSSYEGQRVKVRFRLRDIDTGWGSSQGDGWYLDDIEIREVN
jgi:hypothetical protein